MNERQDTEQLAQLIDRKCEILVQFRDLARRQADVIEAADWTRLMSVLGGKQALLGELHKVERQLDAFRDQDPEQRVWTSRERRCQVRQTAERCEALLRELLLLEKQGEVDLVKRRDDTAHQLQGAHLADHATRAYSETPTPGRPGTFFSSES